MPPVEWFLEINGDKTGPYPSEHLLGLFKEGEIPAEARVTATHLKEQWITVAELARSASRIPERPDIAAAPKIETPKAPDPSHALYENVRKVRPTRDKTGTIAAPAKPAAAKPAPVKASVVATAETLTAESVASGTLRKIGWKKWGPRAGLALILAALVGFSFWGILQLMKPNPNPEQEQELPSDSPRQPPSSGAVAPPPSGWGGARRRAPRDAVPPPTTDDSQPEMGERLPRPPEATPTQHTDPLEVFPRPVEPVDEDPPPVSEPPVYNAPQDYSPPPPPPAEAPNDGGADGAT